MHMSVAHNGVSSVRNVAVPKSRAYLGLSPSNKVTMSAAYQNKQQPKPVYKMH